MLNKPAERLSMLQEPLEDGLTIIYVPTRKETLSIAKYLCGFGVKAAAYNASVCIVQSDCSGPIQMINIFISIQSIVFSLCLSYNLLRLESKF